jgi:hypothetical protein
MASINLVLSSMLHGVSYFSIICIFKVCSVCSTDVLVAVVAACKISVVCRRK